VILLRSLSGNRDDLERLGFRLPQRNSKSPLIWFVASSVGEVGIALKLIARLKASAQIETVLTVTTPAGRRLAAKQGAEIDFLLYHPFDIPWVVQRFLKRLQPETLVMIETELWPTLLGEAAERKVKLIQVAGRLSKTSLSRYLPLKPVMGPLLRSYRTIMTQSESDAARFLRLGALPRQVSVVGSPKGEYTPPTQEDVQALGELLAAWSENLILVAGSTRPGEEKIVLEAFQKAQDDVPNLKLVLAPRHLTRLDEVMDLLQESGISWRCRSEGGPLVEHSILLLDTIGELNLFYHFADVAFVGGTLSEDGGHNLLEPALAGIPVLHGPHYFNQLSGAESLKRHKLGQVVQGPDDMAAAIVERLREGSPRARCAPIVDELRRAGGDIIDTYVERILNC
jgi:3-deoxy-D-manno-octulosonic-acid transferase